MGCIQKHLFFALVNGRYRIDLNMSLYVATHKKTALPKCDWIVPIGLAGYSDELVKLNDAISPCGNEISKKNRN